MISIPRRSLAALAVTGLLLAGSTACGDDKKSSPASSASSSSPDASTSAASVGKEIDVADFVKDLGAAMEAQGSVHMSIAGSSAIKLEADVLYGANPSIKLTTEAMGQEIDFVIVDGDLYLKQGTAKYSKIAKDDPTFGSLLGTFEDFGPRASVKSLEDGISKVVEVGPKTVDGEELLQYDVTADTSKTTGAFGQLAGAQPSSKFVTMSFFVDDTKLIRQIQVDADGQKVAMTFSDWGKPVEIKAPSGAELAATPTA